MLVRTGVGLVPSPHRLKGLPTKAKFDRQYEWTQRTGDEQGIVREDAGHHVP